MINKIRRGSFKGRSASSSVTASQAESTGIPTSSPTPPRTKSDAFVSEDLEVPAAFPGPAPKDAFADPTLGGQYRQFADFELPISLVQFFTLFMSDKAKYSLGDFSRDGGDTDIECAPWTAGCALRAKDAFDFEQCEEYSRERTMSMRCPAGGSSYCTVERFQRYYYYPSDGVFLLRSTNYTKGLPLVDTFAGFEKYVVQESGKRIHVRYFACVIFHKPPFGFLVTQIKKGCDAACIKSGDRYRDKLIALVGINNSSNAVSNNAEKEDEPKSVEAANNNEQVGGDGGDYKSIGFMALGGVLVVWLIVMLLVQYRIALALEQLARTTTTLPQ